MSSREPKRMARPSRHRDSMMTIGRRSFDDDPLARAAVAGVMVTPTLDQQVQPTGDPTRRTGP